MPSAEEWKSTVLDALKVGINTRPKLIAYLTEKYPGTKRPTIEERINYFAIRDKNQPGGIYVPRNTARPHRVRLSSEDPGSGVGWYEHFVETGLKDEFRRGFSTIEKSGDWTKFILGLFRRFGEEAGYSVQGPPELNRWDQSWTRESNAVQVVIEHENDPDAEGKLSSELDHLVHSDAPLRVLITYYPQVHLSEKAEKLVELVKSKLEERERLDCEFLVLVGDWDIDDVRGYKAFLIRPKWMAERM